MLMHTFAVLLLAATTPIEPAKTPPANPAAPTKTAEVAPPATPREDAASPALSEALDVGPWLVDIARHQGHLKGRTDPRSVSLHVIALLKAAVAVSPDCADAYFWLYDLEHRLDRSDAARSALENYVRLNPTDDTARIRCFELEMQQRQTAEERYAFVKSQLEHKPISRVFESELRRWLARYYYERRETDFAAQETEKSLRLNPMNVPARELAYEMFGETEPTLQRIEMAIQLISVNPSQANLVWDLAEYLDSLSLHSRAQEWYLRAIDLHRRANSGPVPAEFWHRLAMSYASARDYEHVKETADKALAVDPTLHTARLLRAEALKKLNQPEAAAEDIKHVAAAYASQIEEVIKNKSCDEAAKIAWFYCYHQPEPALAMKLAKVAMSEKQPSSLAKAAYGFALRLNGRTEEAITTLRPLAEADQIAAYELAQSQIAIGQRSAAMKTLHRGAMIQYSGVGYHLICDLLTASGETPPKPPLNNKVIAALDRFKRDVFDYYETPERFLSFTAAFVDESLTPTGPVNVRFRLENIGPFPITFGEGYMTRPLVALSVRVGSKSNAVQFSNALQILMNARPVLLPGDAFEKVVSINIGPIQQRLLAAITEPERIEISAMLDPVFENGELKPGMGTISSGPSSLIRPAIDVSPEGIDTLLARTSSLDVRERLAAAEQIGALLLTIDAGLPEAAKKTIPIDRLQTGLAELLADEAWQVRARALVAAGWSPLDSRVTVAAAPSVRKEHPIVKLLAVRLFAQQHGEKFRQVLEQLARSDQTDYIRMMATSYLPPITQASASGASIEE